MRRHKAMAAISKRATTNPISVQPQIATSVNTPLLSFPCLMALPAVFLVKPILTYFKLTYWKFPSRLQEHGSELGL